MDEIIRCKYLALYSQIALVDVEDPIAYPEWITGDENAVMSYKGVAVSALCDTLVDVIVYKGRDIVEGFEYLSGVLNVGSKGLRLGNEATASYNVISWPSGKTKFRVFANTPNGNATKIIFVLDPI